MSDEFGDGEGMDDGGIDATGHGIARSVRQIEAQKKRKRQQAFKKNRNKAILDYYVLPAAKSTLFVGAFSYWLASTAQRLEYIDEIQYTGGAIAAAVSLPLISVFNKVGAGLGHLRGHGANVLQNTLFQQIDDRAEMRTVFGMIPFVFLVSAGTIGLEASMRMFYEMSLGTGEALVKGTWGALQGIANAF